MAAYAGMVGEPVSDGFEQPHHPPVPYVVVIRAAFSDDAPTERFEQHVVAYSVTEAIYQAVITLTGQMEISDAAKKKWRLERVEPDLPAYWKQLTDRALTIEKPS